MVNIQYPHKLQVLRNGEFEEISVCRDQPNDKGKLITVADGSNIMFGSIIYAPADTERLKVGMDIKIIGERSEIRLEGEIKRFSADSLHVRIWI